MSPHLVIRVGLWLCSALFMNIALARDIAVYSLSVEWALDSAYSIDVYDQLGSRAGVSIAPALQFDDRHRQTVVMVPALMACNQPKRQFYLAVNAIAPTQPATLFITDDQAIIHQQTIDASVTIELPELRDIACPAVDDDILGELTIAVETPKADTPLNWGNVLRGDLGHAWIIFRGSGPETPIAYATAGTYSSIVGAWVFNGINFYREIYRPATAYKTVKINRQQWSSLVELIDQYVQLGEAGWTVWRNCTQFAVDAWYAATGESLSISQPYPDAPAQVVQFKIPNTMSLYYSIMAHGGTALSAP